MKDHERSRTPERHVTTRDVGRAEAPDTCLLQDQIVHFPIKTSRGRDLDAVLAEPVESGCRSCNGFGSVLAIVLFKQPSEVRIGGFGVRAMPSLVPSLALHKVPDYIPFSGALPFLQFCFREGNPMHF
jgi:hypothetical protein